MTDFPALTGSELIRALRRPGFEVVRSKGSHRFLRHADGRCTVVALHRGETLGSGLLARTLRDCEITKADLLKMLRANALE